MRLTLNQQDIKKALIAHVATLGLNLDGRSVEVELTAGRGANGHSAVVIIDEETESAVAVEVNSKPAPAQAAAKLVEEPQPVAADEEVDLPPVTPETPVAGSGKSLFDQ